jgi:predicted transcriptional regulator
MSWDTDGSRIDDLEQARERAEELSITGIQSALDRANLGWLIDAYDGSKLLLLQRMLSAGPSACKLSTERLARDCRIDPSTVARHRSALVADGVLRRREYQAGRIVFEFKWHKIVALAWDGLMRRPANERAQIIEKIFRNIIDRNAIDVNRDALDYWAAPDIPPPEMPDPRPQRRRPQPSKPDAVRRLSGYQRRKQTRNGNDAVPPGNDGVTLSQGTPSLRGRTEPEGSNLNDKHESLNGPRLARAGHAVAVAPIQATYAGKPTLTAKTIALMQTDPNRHWTRRDLIEAFDVGAGEAQRALKRLADADRIVKFSYGRYRLVALQ